jgi:hypothetical protein
MSYNKPDHTDSVPTFYDDIKFRSRLEVRWYIFFQKLGVKALYEPEVAPLSTGNYWCDFYLPNVRKGCWVEIKPVEPDDRAQHRAEELAVLSGDEVFIFWGKPGVGGQDIYGFETYEDPTRCSICYDGRGYRDRGHAFCVCGCGRVGIEYGGRQDRVCDEVSGCLPKGKWRDVSKAARLATKRKFRNEPLTQEQIDEGYRSLQRYYQDLKNRNK